MDTLIHADVFFFVTTIAVVMVGLTFTVALMYLIKILSDVKSITREVKEETVLFREDLHGLRSDARREGFKIARFAKFFGDILKRKRAKSKK